MFTLLHFLLWNFTMHFGFTFHVFHVGFEHVQGRLVEPRASSLNSGDCFVLVTSRHCYLWLGRKASRLERTTVSSFSTYQQLLYTPITFPHQYLMCLCILFFLFTCGFFVFVLFWLCYGLFLILNHFNE